jgi:DNA polymerase-3 subunit delta
MGSLHLLVGDDDLLLHRAVQDLVDGLTAADDMLSVDVHDAVELESLPSLRTTSLLGDRTGVVVRGLEQRGVKASLKDEIAAFVADPDDEAVLVLVSRGKNQVRKISSRVRKTGTVVEVMAPKPWDDGGWDRIIADEFRRLDRKVGRDVVAAVRRHAGADTAAIASQVAQVVAAAEGDVTVALVDDVLGGHGRESAFTVVDAVVDRDVGAALVALRGLREAGESEMVVFGALASRFRQLLAVRAGLTTPSEVGASPGQIRFLQPAARNNFSAGELAWCQERIARLDVDLKGGSALPPDVVLDLAVIDLATRREEVGPRHNPMA